MLNLLKSLKLLRKLLMTAYNCWDLLITEIAKMLASFMTPMCCAAKYQGCTCARASYRTFQSFTHSLCSVFPQRQKAREIIHPHHGKGWCQMKEEAGQ